MFDVIQNTSSSKIQAFEKSKNCERFWALDWKHCVPSFDLDITQKSLPTTKEICSQISKSFQTNQFNPKIFEIFNLTEFFKP